MIRIKDNYLPKYECEKKNLCSHCLWSNGEQCIRQLLTEEDIKWKEQEIR
jgi:hypothetical protein